MTRSTPVLVVVALVVVVPAVTAGGVVAQERTTTTTAEDGSGDLDREAIQQIVSETLNETGELDADAIESIVDETAARTDDLDGGDLASIVSVVSNETGGLSGEDARKLASEVVERGELGAGDVSSVVTQMARHGNVGSGTVDAVVGVLQGSTTTTPSETTTSTPTTTEPADAEETGETETIYKQLGPESYVEDVEWNPSNDSATVTITTQRPLRLTFTDSSGIDPKEESGTFRQMSQTLSSGTHKVVVPATINDEGNQLVTITGAPKNIWLSNGEVSIFGNIPTAGRWAALLIGCLTPFLLGGARMKYRLRKRERDGAKRVF